MIWIHSVLFKQIRFQQAFLGDPEGVQGRLFDIVKTKIGPKFKKICMKKYEMNTDDIALVELAKPVDVKPVKLNCKK